MTKSEYSEEARRLVFMVSIKSLLDSFIVTYFLRKLTTPSRALSAIVS